MIPNKESVNRRCRIIHEILESLPEYDYKIPSPELPVNGIYFFYEEGEFCTHRNERQKRIVRVGTHRVDGNFRSRVKSHYGGNKNSSVFRKHLGGALMRKKDSNDKRLKQWLEQDAPTFQEIEIEVSKTLKEHFSFKCIPVDDRQKRLDLEKQLIATLSKCSGCLPSEKWLGHHAASGVIRKSGLWNTQHVTSNNTITDDAIKSLKKFANESKSKDTKALFLIPCCSEKIPGGDNPSWDEIHLNQKPNKLQFLDNYRLQLIDFYSELSREAAFNYYKNRGVGEVRNRKVAKAWQKNLRVHKCKTTKAIHRYKGNLYKSLNSNVREWLRNGELDNVLIISALIGIVAPTDLIPDYELMMMDKSPRNRNVWEFWRETFATDEIKKPLQQIFSKFDYIYCLMSTTTGYVPAVTKLLSNYHSYCIIPQERGQTNKLRSWGRVLSEALLKRVSLPEEVKKVAEIHNCIMKELDVKNQERISVQKSKEFGGIKIGLTDKIREFVCKNYIQPGRKRDEKVITIRAGDVHSTMGLASRMPAVCNALKTKIDQRCNVRILKIDSPPSGYGANFYVTYKILNGELEENSEIKGTKTSSRSEETFTREPENIPTIIRHLYELKEDGIITEEEFEKKKKKLLDRL